MQASQDNYMYLVDMNENNYNTIRALEALRNALYKCSTYLLTYLMEAGTAGSKNHLSRHLTEYHLIVLHEIDNLYTGLSGCYSAQPYLLAAGDIMLTSTLHHSKTT